MNIYSITMQDLEEYELVSGGDVNWGTSHISPKQTVCCALQYSGKIEAKENFLYGKQN